MEIKVQEIHITTYYYKTRRNDSILAAVFLAEVKVAALAVISSDYHSQAFTRTQTNGKCTCTASIYMYMYTL